MNRFFAHFLYILAAWTVAIKFILSIAWAVVNEDPITTYIYWDFWWVIHIWLAWALLNYPRYLLILAMITSVSEVLIIVSKFVLFFEDPIWTIWTMNWFINKVFVLACFVGLLVCLATKSIHLQEQVRNFE